MTDFWNETNIAELKQRHANGESMSIMGAALGCSRNAIVGKIHRLKLDPPLIRLSPRGPKPKAAKEPKPKMAPMPKIFIEPQEYINATELSALDGAGVTLEELTNDTCRFPHGHPRDPSFRYCGAMALDGKPYCAKHLEISKPSITR